MARCDHPARRHGDDRRLVLLLYGGLETRLSRKGVITTENTESTEERRV
jgi:hypothetical protein